MVAAHEKEEMQVQNMIEPLTWHTKDGDIFMGLAVYTKQGNEGNGKTNLWKKRGKCSQVDMELQDAGLMPEHSSAIEWKDLGVNIVGLPSGYTAYCGYIHKGAMFFFCTAAEQVFQQNREVYGRAFVGLETSPAQPSEKEFQKAFCSHLRLTHRKVLEYVKCEYGVIDVVVHSDHYCIYELKVNPGGSDILKAIGQLLAYRVGLLKLPNYDQVTEIRLVFVSNKNIEKKWNELFRLCNIDTERFVT